MPLDKETLRKLSEKYNLGYQHTKGDDWSDRNFFWYDDDDRTDFAQAIYELGYGDGASNDINAQTNYNRGVKEERERCLDICNQFASIEGIAEKCAEAIRKGIE